MPLARLVQDKLKSGSGDQAGQAQLKAMLAKEGMKLSPQAWVTLFNELDTNYIGKLEDLVDTLYTLYKDGEILVRWVGDKISHEPLPSTEGEGQDYCAIGNCCGNTGFGVILTSVFSYHCAIG